VAKKKSRNNAYGSNINVSYVVLAGNMASTERRRTAQYQNQAGKWRRRAGMKRNQ